MSIFYNCTTVELDRHTPVEVRWVPSGNNYHIEIGSPCNSVTILLDADQLERLASLIRVAQIEHAETGRRPHESDNELVDITDLPRKGG